MYSVKTLLQSSNIYETFLLNTIGIQCHIVDEETSCTSHSPDMFDLDMEETELDDQDNY